MKGNPTVLARDLTKTFGEFVAVDRVSFEVMKGEVFGFLGPNGAGKTTTIKMLAGLLKPTSGQGSVAGFDLYTETERIKRSIGYMSQLFSLYGDLSVGENIEFFSGLYSVPRETRKERMEWVLEMARLQDERKRLTGELALGFKQRLALGCAILHDPPILFLDEPTSGVDPNSRRSFWDLIYSIAGAGTTVFVTTHYMEEAEYCNRLALMNRGRLIALDEPAELRKSLGMPILELRTSNGPRTVKALGDVPWIIEIGMYGRTVHAIVSDESVARKEIPGILRADGIDLLEMLKVEPSLEDAFVSLVETGGGAPVD